MLLVVGTAAPRSRSSTPAEGQPFEFGDTVSYEVTVVDDQPVDCAEVTVTYILGHDQHGHPLSTATGCTGSITTFRRTAATPARTTYRGVRRHVHGPRRRPAVAERP